MQLWEWYRGSVWGLSLTQGSLHPLVPHFCITGLLHPTGILKSLHPLHLGFQSSYTNALPPMTESLGLGIITSEKPLVFKNKSKVCLLTTQVINVHLPEIKLVREKDKEVFHTPFQYWSLLCVHVPIHVEASGFVFSLNTLLAAMNFQHHCTFFNNTGFFFFFLEKYRKVQRRKFLPYPPSNFKHC